MTTDVPTGIPDRLPNQLKGQAQRLFTCILYLNSGWQLSDSGLLRMYLEGSIKDIVPEMGTFLIFRSDVIYHEVLPAMRKRHSLTGWIRKTDIFGE